VSENINHNISDIETTNLSESENTIAKLALYGLLHLSKIGIVYLGSDKKLLRDFTKYKTITIKQKEEILRIVKVQERRLGGDRLFQVTLRKTIL